MVKRSAAMQLTVYALPRILQPPTAMATGCIVDLGGMPTAVRVGMFDQADRIRAACRLLIAQHAWGHRT